MVRRATTLLVLGFMMMAALPIPGDAQDASATPVRWIVGLEPFPDVARNDTWHGERVLRSDPASGFIVVESDTDFPKRAASDDDVRYIERDVEMQVLHIPNDSRWSSQYGPTRVKAPAAWDITKGTTDKVLCVIDSGLRTSHEDIAGARWLGGRDVADGDDNVADPHGHGTHVTGIAAATMDNAKGIAGIAQVPFKFVKVMESSTGLIYQSDTATGIRWCADNGGHVINLSLGSSQSTSTLSNAITYAYGKGVLIVAASGNDGCSNCVLYPAKYSQVVAVGCTNASDNRCSFSNGGPEVELAAPGYDILSTCYGSNTEYCYKSGTSMSSPTAAGVAALVWSYASHLSRDEIRTVLQQSAIDRGTAGRDSLYGYGIPDADRAIALAKPIAPEASFSATCGGATCSFDGTASSDADGSITGWHWELGDGGIRSVPAFSYTYTQSGTYTVRLRVTDNHGFTDEALRSVTVDVPPPPKAAPTRPPVDPHIFDTQTDLVGDQVPLLHMDIQSVWFDDDDHRLYVGMKIVDIPVNDRTTSFVAYRVYFTPTWEPTDPRLGGVLAPSEVPIRYEARALLSPAGLPMITYMTHELWVEAEDTITRQRTWRLVQTLPGQVSVSTDIIWWPIERLHIGAPQDATLTAPSAVASPSVRGLVNLYGITGDSTQVGRDHTF